jgi:putative ABC transport system permease protein
MFYNQFKLIIRNLIKKRSFSIINILGLAIGMSVCLVILQYVQFELSYDDFHKNKDRVYRTLTSSYTNGEHRGNYPVSGFAQGPSMKQDYPEVESYCRIHPQYGGAVVSSEMNGQKMLFHEENMYYVDSSFFNHFTFTLEDGDARTALSQPMSIVVTREIADKYFGVDSEPVGKFLTLSGGWTEGTYSVTAVLEPLAENSYLEFDFLLSMHDLLENSQYQNDSGWGWSNFVTYIKLFKGTSAENLEEKLPEFVTKYEGESLAETNSEYIIKFQNITDIHLTSGLSEELASTGSSSSVYAFGIIAMFILLIAWVNYINLATSRAPERSKEVGIKKVVGAGKAQLISQFLLESFIINVCAAIIALGFAVFLLPSLGEVIGKSLSFQLLGELNFWLVFISILTVGSILSGLYPAFVLSSFKPASILKSNQSGTGSSILRKSLVVFQFGASLALIAGTLTVYKQISHMRNQDLGMSLEQVLVVNGPRVVDEGVNRADIFYRLKNDLLQLPYVKGVASSTTVPGGGFNWGSSFRKLGDDPEMEKPGNVTWVDTAFISTYQFELIAGHNWNLESETDKNSVIINEAALATFGLGSAENALSEFFLIGDDTVSIIGVLRDFHWSSPKTAREAVLLAHTAASSRNYSIRLETTDFKESLAEIQLLYSKHSPGNPFDYFFMDDFFNKQYQSDMQFGKIFGIFSLLAVLVGCLGLFGLVSYTVVQKTKEIGIRKVLGAEVTNIVLMLSRQFVILVLVASFIAIPIIYFGMTKWLSGYAFPISIGWELVILPILILLTIAVLTVSLQTIRAAIANPVKSIKAE